MNFPDTEKFVWLIDIMIHIMISIRHTNISEHNVSNICLNVDQAKEVNAKSLEW